MWSCVWLYKDSSCVHVHFMLYFSDIHGSFFQRSVQVAPVVSGVSIKGEKFPQLTRSFIRAVLFGGFWSIKSWAKRLCLSTACSSLSNNWSMAFLEAGIGIANVAHNTLDAILQKNSKEIIFSYLVKKVLQSCFYRDIIKTIPTIDGLMFPNP